jgi:hypothetical protein
LTQKRPGAKEIETAKAKRLVELMAFIKKSFGFGKVSGIIGLKT